MKTIINALKHWTQDKIAEQNQKIDNINKRIENNKADWSENDPNVDSYIKNRPFYEEVQYITSVPEQIVNCVAVDSEKAFGYFENENSISDGTICRVTFDGVVYDNIVVYEIASDLSFYMDITLENGEEISIMEARQLIVPANMAGEHTISIECKENTIAPIDNKFLPFSVYSGEGVDAVKLNYSANVSSGAYAVAEGRGTEANGDYSHAEGYSTISQRKSQHVQGEFNIVDTKGNTYYYRGKYAHIVGNGTSDTARSNAHTLDWDGVGWYQGGLQVGGNAQDDGAKNVLLEGDAIPMPATAEAGQILAVKTVDENGKPTEWGLVTLSLTTDENGVVSITMT